MEEDTTDIECDIPPVKYPKKEREKASGSNLETTKKLEEDLDRYASKKESLSTSDSKTNVKVSRIKIQGSKATKMSQVLSLSEKSVSMELATFVKKW